MNLQRISEQCLNVLTPFLCRYAFPTCDPAFGYDTPTPQAICRRDCEIVRDFYCPEVWQELLRNLSAVPDGGAGILPDCGLLSDADGGTAPMCVSILDGGVYET